MLQDSFEDLGLGRSRGTFAPFAVEFQPRPGAKEEVDPDLPRAATPDVYVLGQMIGGVELQLQAIQSERLYSPHGCLGFIGTPIPVYA
jgi:hypothetical protein